MLAGIMTGTHRRPDTLISLWCHSCHTGPSDIGNRAPRGCTTMLFQQPKIDDNREPPPLTVAAMVLAPLAFLSFSECAFGALHRSLLRETSVGPQALAAFPVAVVPIVAIPTFLSLRYRKVGLLSSLVGLTITFIAVTQFRGSYSWAGLFDNDSIPSTPLWICLPVGTVLGAVAGSSFWKKSHRRYPHRIVYGAIAGSILWAWFDSRFFQADSLVPYARHVSVSVITAVVVLGAFIAHLAHWGDASD